MNERRKSEQKQLELVTTIGEQIDLMDHSSAKSINVLTGESVDNVYKKKTRILSRLEKTNPVLYRELKSLL